MVKLSKGSQARIDEIVRDHSRAKNPPAPRDRGHCSDAHVIRAIKGCQAAMSGLSLRAKGRVIAGLRAGISEPGEL